LKDEAFSRTVKALTSLSAHERNLFSRVAGEIVLSEDIGGEMKKWREFFNVQPKALSQRMGVSPSVISDYEGGRIENPGANFVKKFVKALFEFDKERGGVSILELTQSDTLLNSVLLEKKDFASPISLKRFSRAVAGEILIQDEPADKVCGFAVIDCQKAIESFSGLRFLQFLEGIAGKATVFVNIGKEASPIVLLRLSLLKPKVLAYHGLQPTELEVGLAKDEHLTLIYSKAVNVEALMRSLRKLHRSVSSKGD